jgi:copper chaperone
MIRLRVDGMTCKNCVGHVREALAGVPGALRVEVDLLPGEARVEGSPDPTALLAAVAEEGYSAQVLS